MYKEEKFVGGLANGTKANNDEDSESSDAKDSSLDEFHVERSRSQAKE